MSIFLFWSSSESHLSSPTHIFQNLVRPENDEKKKFLTFGVEKKHKKRVEISHPIMWTVSSFTSSPASTCVCVSVHHTHYDITGVHFRCFLLCLWKKLYDLSLFLANKILTEILFLWHRSLENCVYYASNALSSEKKHKFDFPH